jgi:hypothetical protein
MPTFSNVHAELENNELHPPRDFSLAENDTLLSKNPLGDIQWQDTYWQRPVLGFADATFPPLTLQQGDRYILFGNASVGSTVVDTSIDTSVDTIIWMDTSMDSTGIVVYPEPETTVHPAWGDVAVGEIVEYFKTNGQGQSVFEWRAVTPKSGYQIFNLADRQTYYFSGTTWLKQTAQPTLPQVAATYAELTVMIATAALEPWQRYLIVDRDIILTANSASAFSIEGDYTQALPAHGYLQLTSGTAGSIDGISINGEQLLTAPIAFDSNLIETAALVADAINDGTSVHGFSAINIGAFIYLTDAEGRGAVLNGIAIVVAATGIGVNASPLAMGANKGEHWFKVKYRFADDWIAEMADSKGNVVSCEPELIDLVGINPYQAFPWAYDAVTGNTVTDSVFVAYPNGGVINNNTFSGRTFMVCSLTETDTIAENKIGNQCFVKLTTSGDCSFVDNAISLSGFDLQMASGEITSNKIIASNLVGQNFDCTALSLNHLNGVNLFLSNATINSLAQNTLVDGEYLLSGATVTMNKNNLSTTDVAATGATFQLSENQITGTVLDISEAAAGFIFSHNHISGVTEIELQRAEGQFAYNVIANSQLHANDTNVYFLNNQINNQSDLTLTNYTGGQFFGNTLSATTLDLTDSTGEFTRNKVHNSIVTMQRHSGDCNQNVFAESTITSNDSGSDIDNNNIDKSTVKLSNTNGHFSSNHASFYSTYDLDGYLGAGITINKIDSGSQLIANNYTSTIGGVIIGEDTKLDVSNQSNLLYDCFFKIPSKTIFLTENQVSRYYNFNESTLESSLSIDSSGVLDLGTVDAAYSGSIWINNTETLDEIHGLSHSPRTITLRPVASQTLSLSASSSQIKFASGIVNQPIDGSNGGFVVFKNGASLVVTQLYPG